jgi:site-specific recombinase XerD
VSTVNQLLAAMVTAKLRKVVARLPPTLGGARDKALLTLGFAGALRRSELVALQLDGPDVDLPEVVSPGMG